MRACWERSALAEGASEYQCPDCGHKPFKTAGALSAHHSASHKISGRLFRFAMRHGMNCMWCGEPVVTDGINRDHPLAPTREHLVPKALNGKTTAGNLGLAHRRCNALRAHADEGGYLRL